MKRWVVLAAGVAGCSIGTRSDGPATFGGSTGDGGSSSTTLPAATTGISATDDSESSSGSGEGEASESGSSIGVDESSTSGSSTAGTTSGSTGPATAPVVVLLSPAEDEVGIVQGQPVAVTFDQPMEAATITANVDDSDCTGTVQVSADDFASCVRMGGEPITADDTTFIFDPVEEYVSLGEYRVRVLSAVQSAAGVAMEGTFTSAEPFTVRYFHTIAIDGANDFAANETFPTSSNGHVAYTAWDSSYVYFGLQSPDVASGDANVWVVVYFGGSPGTNAGVVYNTQQPALPFDARYHVRWRASNDFTDVMEFDGVQWQIDGNTFELNPGDVYQSEQFVELRVSLFDLALPPELHMHLGILRETDLSEASWAAHPGGSYVDGYDPDYGEYWAFDVDLSPIAPADSVPLP
jgi:hypothetical protein